MTTDELIKKLSREEKIDIIVEDRLTEWVYAQITDGLEEMLMFYGWEPLDERSNEKLDEYLEEFDEEQLKDYLESSKERNKKK